MDYEKRFKKLLLTEEDGYDGIGAGSQDTPVNMSPDEGMSDSDAWNQNNPDISANDELRSKFDVEGLNAAEIEKYSIVIDKWSQGLQAGIEQLAEMLKFQTGERLKKAPGSELFEQLASEAPKLKAELSAFKSNVDDLKEAVKLAISSAAEESRKETKK
jgi:hypothetical protein